MGQSANLVAEAPDLMPAPPRIDDIALECRFDPIKADTVVSTPHEGNIFSMRPTQRHGRTRWQTGPHISLRQIFGVPQLLADHATFIGELFHRGNERHWIASGSNLVMAAFPRQNRPGAAHAPAIESAAVLLLPITIMIVAAPARTLRQ